MCGIAGFVNIKRSQFSPDAAWLDSMQKRLEHRGPDGHRVWVDHTRGAGFVHRRLSILDLSAAGFQPMIDDENSVVVMCNGEIYNHPQLKKDLEEWGAVYRSNSDTETILHAYKRWGIGCLPFLRGMFSIAIFDLRTNEFFLVRDRIGIKPLYFSLQGGVISFASEIKALWELPWINKTINPLGLYHYLTYMVSPAPLTLYKGIYKLPASYYLKLDAHGSIKFVEWYTPIKGPSIQHMFAGPDESDYVGTIRKLLNESISSHMMSDVPYGVFLSGGIDSSLNVALMAQMTEQVKTFTVAFDDGPEYSELGWARKVARTFNTDHHEIIISEKEAFDFFEKMVYHQDEPLADCVCIPLYYVSKLLKDAGVTVVQVGEGSDELFCGYTSYARYLDVYNKYWAPSQKFVPAFAKKGALWAAEKVFKDNPNRIDLVKNWANDRSIFWSGATAFSEEWKQQIVRRSLPEFDAVLDQICPGFDQSYDSYAVADYHLRRLKTLDPNADFFKSMMYLEFKQRLPELLLMRVDKMTMATSVEGRVPFLDHSLVEYAFTIPIDFKYKDGQTKYILKKAAEGILPQEIIYRPKMGFAAPTMRWFKKGSYFRTYFMDMLQSRGALWREYLDEQALETLFKNNEKMADREYSVQLWTIQNLMSMPL